MAKEPLHVRAKTFHWLKNIFSKSGMFFIKQIHFQNVKLCKYMAIWNAAMIFFDTVKIFKPLELYVAFFPSSVVFYLFIVHWF